MNNEAVPAVSPTGATQEVHARQRDTSTADPLQEKAETPRIGLIATLDDLPAVASYLQRVSARAINFRSARVEGAVNGYPKTLGTLTFDGAGKVTVRGDADPPTDSEQAAIEQAFKAATFPELTSLVAIAQPPPECDLKDGKTFVFHDFAGRIVMVQRRYDNQDRTKGFLSHTPWSDGIWRPMEPEKLPFLVCRAGRGPARCSCMKVRGRRLR